MPKLTKNQVVELPKNVSINKKGYVYYNYSSFRKNGQPDHEKILIGRTITNTNINWKENPLMYPNNNYFRLFDTDKLPEVAEHSDHISVGGYLAIRKLSDESGLTKTLLKVFEKDDVALILDLAMFMNMAKDAAFYLYPDWAVEHEIFSDSIKSDGYISEFERRISIAQIEEFKYLWASHAIGNGKVFLCYDSTNVNSQADGIDIVEMGHAKDDPSKPQVNTDYVVREDTGLPVTFTAFPGSISDIAEASEMIDFFEEILEEDKSIRLELTIVADRGYLSEKNIIDMDKAKIGFLLMLKNNFNITTDIIDRYCDEIKSINNYIEERKQYSKTVKAKWLGQIRYFHITFDFDLDKKNTKTFIQKINKQEEKIKKLILRHHRIDNDEYKNYSEYFKLKTDDGGVLRQKKRGKEKNEVAYVITSFERKKEEIDKKLKQCGLYVLVSSQEMTALEAYSKRNCIERVFLILKNFLGGDKVGVQSTDAVETKSLIWFVASILHSLIFTKTMKLREKERSAYSMPEVFAKLHRVWCYKNVRSGKYIRLRKLTDKQKKNFSRVKNFGGRN